MNLERFCLKFFTQPNTAVDDAVFIDIFHEWIRYQKLDGILLDVVDYRHVPHGPSIMLITHNINFAMDYTDGRFGLLAQQKLGQAENRIGRILELVRATAAFGTLLESDWRVKRKLSLAGGQFHLMSNDRLRLPNTAAAYAGLLSDLEAAAAILYPGQAVSVARLENDPRERLTAVVNAEIPVEIRALMQAVVKTTTNLE